MLNTKLPRARYNTATYPHLEERADGAPIPIAIGNLHGVIPVCINTDSHIFKFAGHAIHSIDALRTEKETLTLSDDYTADLANAEFTILETPYLAANTTYYFVIEADYAVSGSNYINLKRFGNVYGNGQLFTIDGSGVWTADSTHDLRFQIYGREELNDQEKVRVNNNVGSASNVGLKDAAARTRLAQSFKTGTKGFYCTRLHVWHSKIGSPTGNLRVSILSAYTPAETQLGVKSQQHEIDRMGACRFFFPLRTEVSNITGDIEGAEKTAVTITDGAGMLEYYITTPSPNGLGKSLSILDAVALANFKTKRTQTIKYYLDRDDVTFGEIVGKLETSLLFKFVPLHDGSYAPTVYEAGEPAGTPHFFDEHFKSFSMRRNFSAVKSNVKIKYDENPGNNEFKVAEFESNVARFVYGVEEDMEVETFLTNGTQAAAMAASYGAMYERPPLEITFEVAGYGLDMIPGRDKVKITRTRAAYSGGVLSGVLFRVVKLTKKPKSATTEIVAVLDEQTY